MKRVPTVGGPPQNHEYNLVPPDGDTNNLGAPLLALLEKAALSDSRRVAVGQQKSLLLGYQYAMPLTTTYWSPLVRE